MVKGTVLIIEEVNGRQRRWRPVESLALPDGTAEDRSQNRLRCMRVEKRIKPRLRLCGGERWLKKGKHEKKTGHSRRRKGGFCGAELEEGRQEAGDWRQ